jgi:hypothetical protein
MVGDGSRHRLQQWRAIAFFLLVTATGFLPDTFAQARPRPTSAEQNIRAQDVPMPRPRPRPPSVTPPAADETQTAPASAAPALEGPSDCLKRLTAGLAIAKALPPITGPGACHGEDVVELSAVIVANKAQIKLSPPAILRCPMAEAFAHWMRDEAEPKLRASGPVTSVLVAASFTCRGRNNVANAKLSEHGLANAIDVRGFTLANGKSFVLTDVNADKTVREALRDSACGDFTTVLGPESDGYHEEHIHLDRIERRNGYRICQWAVREPGEAKPQPEEPASAQVARTDDEAPKAIAPPSVPMPRPVARSASCHEGQACPRAASPRRARAPRHGAARRSAGPRADFRW